MHHPYGRAIILGSRNNNNSKRFNRIRVCVCVCVCVLLLYHNLSTNIDVPSPVQLSNDRTKALVLPIRIAEAVREDTIVKKEESLA
mmetsp:Transcript_56224/g.62975  ORF Transcript_56224/g.62975 Transcript_56224/m.62975 type:complete len:86 (-) Transcript_56224:96-353(-)